MSTQSEPLLQVRDLSKEYPLRRGLWQRAAAVVRAVDDVSFDLWPGETLGLVGESGSGKTTLGKAIVRLVEPTAGDVVLRLSAGGQHQSYQLLKLSPRALRRLRCQVQMVFQNPFRSFNPRLTIGASIAEGVRAGRNCGAAECRTRVRSLLQRVGLDGDAANEYPHAFSGGQLQRMSIARALASEPSLIVCDEVVSALDVSVQAQVLNLLADLQREHRIAYLFISHDLKLVAQISQRVVVMKAGRLIETATARELFTNPRDPYTRKFLSAVPGIIFTGGAPESRGPTPPAERTPPA